MFEGVLLAGPVEFSTGESVILLLLLFVMPAMAVIGGVMLVAAALRFSCRHPTNPEDLTEPSRIKALVVIGGILCGPMILFETYGYWSWLI